MDVFWISHSYFFRASFILDVPATMADKNSSRSRLNPRTLPLKLELFGRNGTDVRAPVLFSWLGEIYFSI